MCKYEYRYESFDTDIEYDRDTLKQIEQWTNDLAKEGWRMICAGRKTQIWEREVTPSSAPH